MVACLWTARYYAGFTPDQRGSTARESIKEKYDLVSESATTLKGYWNDAPGRIYECSSLVPSIPVTSTGLALLAQQFDKSIQQPQVEETAAKIRSLTLVFAQIRHVTRLGFTGSPVDSTFAIYNLDMFPDTTTC
ncbi:hypothetical protein TEQG_08860 [Trichophyton equinum CBS 127.97]|uniref:Uncharacterized protein n=1 Tax=Trichophyton equinum (strain ATCC MYA-4606 / CBS 127.97) TaxID=559882 RepID=F2Q622_TRIEC|nr:hypothetical protein TEQG_08860 [Trichophyton equinum CBS 127.97]